MSEQIKNRMYDLRGSMEVYLDLLDSHEEADGETKKALSKALDSQLEKCILITDDVMRIVHDELVEHAREAANEQPVNA